MVGTLQESPTLLILWCRTRHFWGDTHLLRTASSYAIVNSAAGPEPGFFCSECDVRFLLFPCCYAALPFPFFALGGSGQWQCELWFQVTFRLRYGGTVRIEMVLLLDDVDGTYGSESPGGWLYCTRGVAIWQMAVLATRHVMDVDESEDPELNCALGRL